MKTTHTHNTHKHTNTQTHKTHLRHTRVLGAHRLAPVPLRRRRRRREPAVHATVSQRHVAPSEKAGTGPGAGARPPAGAGAVPEEPLRHGARGAVAPVLAAPEGRTDDGLMIVQGREGPVACSLEVEIWQGLG